jgi:hypothetical protein
MSFVAPGVVVKNLVTTLDLDKPRVVLDEGLKDTHGQQYRGGLCGRVCSHTTAHGPKNAFSEFMDLSDTNYKFMDQKMHFQSLWTYVFKVYGPK